MRSGSCVRIYSHLHPPRCQRAVCTPHGWGSLALCFRRQATTMERDLKQLVAFWRSPPDYAERLSAAVD